MIIGNQFAWIAAPFGMVLIGILLRGIFLINRIINRISSPVHRSRVLHNFSFIKMLVRTCLVSASLLVLWGGLLRLQYEPADKKPISEQGRDVIIALDISRSMLAQDCQPSRLACAKGKIKTLLVQLTSERVGLIIFAGSAIVQCPLTKDFEIFELFLDAIDVESLSQGTTDVGSALQAAISIFEQNAERKNKLLVLFTDGEDFSSDLAIMQKKAADLGVRVCAMGMGTPEGAPIPYFDQDSKLQGHVRDEQDNVVMSRLNEPVLKSLITSLSGLYVRVDVQSDKDIDRLCAWLKKFEKEQFAVTNQSLHEETFMYFTGIGLILLLMSTLL